MQHDVKELWLPPARLIAKLWIRDVFRMFFFVCLQPSSAAARLLAGDSGLGRVVSALSFVVLASQSARRWLLGTDAVLFFYSLTSRRRQGTIIEISNMNRGLNPLPGGNFQTDRYGSAGYGVCYNIILTRDAEGRVRMACRPETEDTRANCWVVTQIDGEQAQQAHAVMGPLQATDLIHAIDFQSLYGKSQEEVELLLAGNPHSTIVLTVSRPLPAARKAPVELKMPSAGLSAAHDWVPSTASTDRGLPAGNPPSTADATLGHARYEPLAPAPAPPSQEPASGAVPAQSLSRSLSQYDSHQMKMVNVPLVSLGDIPPEMPAYQSDAEPPKTTMPEQLDLMKAPIFSEQQVQEYVRLVVPDKALAERVCVQMEEHEIDGGGLGPP